MKRLLLLLVVFCHLLIAPLGAGAQAKVPPKPATSIYVQDQAGVLSKNTRAAINAYSTALQKKTKAQIVVLTVPSLQGQSLEDYSLTRAAVVGHRGTRKRTTESCCWWQCRTGKAGSKWDMGWKEPCPTGSPDGSRISTCCLISAATTTTRAS